MLPCKLVHIASVTMCMTNMESMTNASPHVQAILERPKRPAEGHGLTRCSPSVSIVFNIKTNVCVFVCI